MLYTESDAPVEPSQEDIDEFARRIGIDPETEPHLMHLARQGLLAKLPPDWKPCKDSHRDVWFYYNNKTHQSQWDHPMDDIYRLKVVEARQEHVMNRIQTFDPSGSKPLKSLPPLKKSGGGLSPLAFPPTPLGNKLGPLRNPSFSSSDDISQYSSSQKAPLQQLDPLRGPQPLGTKNLGPASQLNGRLSSSTSNLTVEPSGRQRIKLNVPSAMPAPVKKSGLTLTGAGASFLKSAKNSSTDLTKEVENSHESHNGLKSDKQEDGFFHPQTGEDHTEGGTGSSVSETGSGKPLKSILSKSLKNRTRLDEIPNPSSPPKNMWDISLKDMTADEYEMWNSLDYKKKGTVKFNLEDPKLKFDFSNHDDTDNENETENSEEEETTDDNDEEDDPNIELPNKSDKSAELSESLADRPMSAGDSKFVTMQSRVGRNQTEDPADSKRVESLQPSDRLKEQNKDLVVDRVTMKASIEKQIKEYQDKLEVERREQESAIKMNMEKSIESFRREMEDTLRKTKEDLNLHKSTEIAKARSEMETNLKNELDKLREEYKEKLERKRQELADDYEREIKELEAKNERNLRDVKKDPRYAQAGQDYEQRLAEEMARLKTDLEDEHKQDIEELKDTHKKTIEKLKQNFTKEEEKVKKEHSLIVAEMLSKFDSERQNLVKTFEEEKEKIKAEFSIQASALTTELAQSLQSIRKNMEEDQKQKLSALTNASNASVLKQLEDELSSLKIKYSALEKKYSNLKEGSSSAGTHQKSKFLEQTLDSVADPMDSHMSAPREDRHDTTDSGAAESDTSCSLSISGRAENNGKREDPGSRIGTPDRLTQALKALEELKEQIMEIKTEQKLVKGGNEDKNREIARSPQHNKIYSSSTLPLSDVRARSSKSAIETFNPQKLQIRSSSTKDISDERNYVDEAKDFIKSQKYRLKRSGLSFGTPVSTSVGAKQRQDHRINSLNSTRSTESHSPTLNYYKRNNQDHHSETESSGVGSLQEISGDRSKVSQDIEGILSSLQQLDGQMKYLWSVVGGTGASTTSEAIAAPTLTSRSPISIPVNSNPLLKPSGLASLALTESSLKYNLAPNLITPGNQALINSINTVNSAQFRRSIDITPKPILSSLEDQINSIRSRQTRILKQYPLESERNQDRSPSLSERTKDLREWLEKF